MRILLSLWLGLSLSVVFASGINGVRTYDNLNSKSFLFHYQHSQLNYRVMFEVIPLEVFFPNHFSLILLHVNQISLKLATSDSKTYVCTSRRHLLFRLRCLHQGRFWVIFS